MLPSHLSSSYVTASNSTSSSGHTLSRSDSAPVIDLKHQFPFTLSTEPDDAASMIDTFVVPPRLRTNADTLQDDQIIQTLNAMGGNLAQWQFSALNDAHGGRTLTCIPPVGQTRLPASAVMFSIGPDHALQALEIDFNGQRQIALFEEKRVSAQALQRRAPSWLSSPNTAATTSGKRQLTPPSPPLAHRQRTEAVGSSGWTHAGLQQQAQEQARENQNQQTIFAPLKAATTRPPLQENMAVFSMLPPVAPVVVNTERFPRDGARPAASYSVVTINGPHVDEQGSRKFYLERQDGWTSAQHAANALIGGPLFLPTDFARQEAARRYQIPTPQQIEDAEQMQRGLGIHADDVHAAFRAAGIAVHRFPGPDAMHTIDPEQFSCLDTINTDRLLLEAHSAQDDLGGSGHWVAFRKDGTQWVLLDSRQDEPQHGVTPSAYLDAQGASHFTAIWPKHQLVAPAATIPYDYQTAKNHWVGERAKEFEPWLEPWRSLPGNERKNGPGLLRAIWEKCEAQGQGALVADNYSYSVREFTVTLGPGMEPMTVWCGLYSSDLPNSRKVPILRLAPVPGDEKRKNIVLREIESSLVKSRNGMAKSQR